MHHPTDRIIHTTAFVTPIVEHWVEREIAQWVHHEGSIRLPIAPLANALTTELHLAPWHVINDTRQISEHIVNKTEYIRLNYTLSPVNEKIYIYRPELTEKCDILNCTEIRHLVVLSRALGKLKRFARTRQTENDQSLRLYGCHSRDGRVCDIKHTSRSKNWQFRITELR